MNWLQKSLAFTSIFACAGFAFAGEAPNPAPPTQSANAATTPSTQSANIVAAASMQSAPSTLSLLVASQAAYDRGMELQRTDTTAARVQFESAAKGFQALINQGAVNGPLLYNLGNAQLQLSQTGAAIGSYLQAQRLMPGDSRLQANLAHARTLVKDRFDRGNGLLLEDVAAWWHLLSQQNRFILAAFMWISAWSIVIVVIVRLRAPAHTAGRLRSIAIPVACTLLITGAVLLCTVVVDVIAPNWRPQGVTVSDGVVVRKGNGDGFEPAFAQPLSQGVEFRVLEQRPGWIQIRLPDGNSGWIKSLQARTA